MAKLTEPQKMVIVRHLARYRTPSEVVEVVKEELGLEITRQQASFYDPTGANGKTLSEPLKQLFWETRQHFLEHVEEIPTANLAVRIRMLDDLARSPKVRANSRLLLPVLEQVAKEVGGLLTNRRELSGPGGKPIPVEHGLDLTRLSDESLAALEQLIAQASGAAEPGGDPEGEE